MPVEQTLTSRPVAIVAAHPDDETVGAGGLLGRMREPVIIHATDGAPRNLADALAAGYQTREDYAAARRQELFNAMELVGVGQSQLRMLDFADQDASLHMAEMTNAVGALLRELRPAVVLTHSYEGGHPDHDAVAFAVHAACALAPFPAVICEFAMYHQTPAANDAEDPAARIETGRFLPWQDAGKVVTLTEEERERKSKMVDCYGTQTNTLRQFPLDAERFRPAPLYDFSQSPHPGRLFYEYFDWGMTGARWRALAVEAARQLGLPEAV